MALKGKKILLIAGGVAISSILTIYCYQKWLKRRSIQLPKEVEDKIIEHMNKNHQDALTAFAKYHGHQEDAIFATMAHLDAYGINLYVKTTSTPKSIRLNFDKPLHDSHGIMKAFVDMAKVAAKDLRITLRLEEEDVLNRDPTTDTEYGFARAEMNTKTLAGTVKYYNTHIFLSWKSAVEWPKNIEEGDESLLPQIFAKHLKASKDKILGKVRLNVMGSLEAEDEGTLLIFPHNYQVQGVNSANSLHVIQALLIDQDMGKLRDIDGISVSVAPPSHIFICSHMKRDKRCGLIGPYLVQEFRRLIESKSLGGTIVRACSHVGGHNYAGNVLVFCKRSIEGEVEGHWYGYVTPTLVHEIVERHIVKGELVMPLWRGVLGKTEKEQVDTHNSICNNCACGKTKL